MFFFSFCILAIFLCSIQADLWMLKSILIAISVTALEAISVKGTDNIIVPIYTALILTTML